MDPLAWLGLRSGAAANPQLTAIQAKVRALLPEDEPVVIRYIVIVSVLLTRVARSDGRVLECELEHLRVLFRHIARLPPESIDELCTTLDVNVPRMTAREHELCFAELKALCDGTERRQILRLCASQARADGLIRTEEQETLREIAQRLGVAEDEMEEIEIEALASSAPPLSFDSIPPDGDAKGRMG